MSKVNVMTNLQNIVGGITPTNTNHYSDENVHAHSHTHTCWCGWDAVCSLSPDVLSFTSNHTNVQCCILHTIKTKTNRCFCCFILVEMAEKATLKREPRPTARYIAYRGLRTYSIAREIEKTVRT